MDLLLLKTVQGFNSPLLDQVFIFITRMGESWFYVPLLAIIYWCVHRQYAIRIGLAFLASSFINSGLKAIIGRQRPIGTEGIRSLYTHTAGGTSFPSGHTQNATVFWRTVACCFRYFPVRALGLIIVVSIGISRLYLGVHWPSDVLGGLTFGLLVAEGFAWAERRLTTKQKNILLTITGVVIHVACIQLPSYQRLTIAGLFMGAVLGTLWERRFVLFQSNTEVFLQAIKVILGMTGVLLLDYGTRNLFPPGAPFYEYLRNLLIGFWVMGGAPWVFVRFGLTPGRSHAYSAHKPSI